MKEYCVGVIGALGAVGGQMRDILADSNINIGKVKMFERPELEGEMAEFDGEEVPCEVATPETLSECDVATMSAGSAASEKLAPMAADVGCVVVDNSSQWRLDPEVPLVVPEVNPEDLDWHKGIIANPNCSTIQMMVALKPLHDYGTIKRVVVSTYQAVSGSGKKAFEGLKDETRQFIETGYIENPRAYHYPIAFNCLPHIDLFQEGGYTKEEYKMVNETKKILDEKIKVNATCVRVPVLYGHSEMVNIETETKITPEKARELLSKAPSIKVVDNVENNEYPMPLYSNNEDLTMVGRIREDYTIERGLTLWVVSNNIRKGAALNAVQVAETLIQRNIV